MKAFLDNIPVAYETAQMLYPVITFRKKDEEGLKAFTFAGDLQFVSTDYTYLKGKLWDSPTALTNEVEFKFEDDCCGGIFPFTFKIKFDTIQWCEDSCTITAAAVEKSEVETAITCLKNNFIWDDTPTNTPSGIPFTQKSHPRFTYCNELRPSWHHDFVIITAISIAFLTLILIPIVAAVQVIITGLNNLIAIINNVFSTSLNDIDFDGDPTTNSLQEFQAWRDRLIKNVIGCGRKHPSPLIRDYAENVCGKCGLTFKSSIFSPGSDYFNACYHNAPVDKGVKVGDSQTFWLDKNKPLLTGFKFFDQIAGHFNSSWDIKNGVLTLERKDFFNPVNPWLDVTILEENTFQICYSWSKKQRPSFGIFEYAPDPVNTIGTEAKFRYGDIVEWNVNPTLPTQKGELKPVIEFSACRFRDDHVRLSDGPERDILSTYKGDPFVGPFIQQFDNVVLLNQHLCYTPMILIWDGDTPLSDARVSGAQFGQDPNNSEATPGEYYNYPMWFDEQLPGNMYTNFWFIENPRHSAFQGKNYDLTVELTCERIQNMDLDGMVKTPEGTGKVDEIILDYKSKKMKIKGTI